MKINQAGIDLLKSFERCRLTAYPDPGTGGDPWTCGWGSTGSDITEGTVWTQQQADDRLAQDLVKFENGVSGLLMTNINENQFSALVCFAYNVGLGNLRCSHLIADVNNGNFARAADEFLKWDYAGGKVLPGLLRRREAERTLFLS